MGKEFIPQAQIYHDIMTMPSSMMDFNDCNDLKDAQCVNLG